MSNIGYEAMLEEVFSSINLHIKVLDLVDEEKLQKLKNDFTDKIEAEEEVNRADLHESKRRFYERAINRKELSFAYCQVRDAILENSNATLETFWGSLKNDLTLFLRRYYLMQGHKLDYFSLKEKYFYQLSTYCTDVRFAEFLENYRVRSRPIFTRYDISELFKPLFDGKKTIFEIEQKHEVLKHKIEHFKNRYEKIPHSFREEFINNTIKYIDDIEERGYIFSNLYISVKSSVLNGTFPDLFFLLTEIIEEITALKNTHFPYNIDHDNEWYVNHVEEVIGNAVADLYFRDYLLSELSSLKEGNTTNIHSEVVPKKIKWIGTPAQFGFIIDLLIQGGYLERPTGSYQNDAFFYLKHFDIKGTQGTLAKELSENTNSIETKYRKNLKIPHSDKLSKPETFAKVGGK